ncbi:hypothetical protein BAX97_01170 [Elizabethkingia meningoseptica]|uniref:DUF4349 domain-containing protein n=1 Tax=Elizabethkingia meningoseptica TaxID=238 RepID=UPI000332CCC5|nr:DUF4349 domain-containing protein [Elizabethkingia meningoseptica]AQX06974.1 hypothetical protein BBD33_04310 [Elizabethkingia meningoseptica]AQX46560.1 hypothetical protein B5G46_04305 [Elizabethkingia meningoseptica]EOR31479.1 hypothetical protein L100_00545 [Elizabethkingia meningoseptica ATCC 13253 = NBRC 12535]KUY19348.1 hypothetical protein ATB99_04715 [Elizabethkingia meningoseptica]MDE5490177.1 DUF4349 domain-containing protein [Elizabethkingia meningoseptica]
MKNNTLNLTVAAVLILSVFSCKKQESSAAGYDNNEKAEVTAEGVVPGSSSDAISSAASTQAKDKEFVKTATVDMEVKDVYDATVKIENQLKEIGGYVTNSELHNNLVSEETYNQTDEKAMMVKKSNMQNNMTVKVPTLQLADFLQAINGQNLFLNSRIINAEDVTANIKMAQLEQQRMQKKTGSITNLKPTSKTVEQNDDNEREKNQNAVEAYSLRDNIAYSTVNLVLREPNVRVAEIPVVNTKSVDAKYKTNFFYEAKLSFINGFYLIQQFFILLLNLWPFMLLIAAIIYLFRFKSFKKKNPNTQTPD